MRITHWLWNTRFSRICSGHDFPPSVPKWKGVPQCLSCLRPMRITPQFRLHAWSGFLLPYYIPQTSLIPYSANTASIALASETLGSTSPFNLFKNAIRVLIFKAAINFARHSEMSPFLTCDHPCWMKIVLYSYMFEIKCVSKPQLFGFAFGIPQKWRNFAICKRSLMLYLCIVELYTCKDTAYCV